MRFPKLNVRAQSREFIQEFGGLDRRARISENCFAEMQNLTGDHYPALAPRRKRGIVGTDQKYNAVLTAGEHVAYVAGNTLYWGDIQVELTAGEDVPRQLVMMGAYIVVFPDAMYLNTADTADQGDFHVLMESKQHEFTFSMYHRANTDALPQAEEDLLSVAEDAKCQLVGTKYDFGDEKIVYEYHSPHTLEVSNQGTSGNPVQTVLEGVPNPRFYIYADGVYYYPFKNYDVSLNIGVDFGAEKPYYLRLDASGTQFHAIIDATTNELYGTITVTNKETGKTVVHQLKPQNVEGHEADDSSGYWLRYTKETGALALYLNNEKADAVLCVSSDWFSQNRIEDGTEANASLNIEKGDGFLIPYLLGVPTGNVQVYFQGGCMWMRGALCGTSTFTTVSKNADAAQNYTFSVDVAALPSMDFVIESQNRLWGCRYGVNANGKFVNEIYASVLGDFRQWYTFAGVSTDSYVAPVGLPGPFTGAVNYRGYPLFFKENVMYKVYGDYPESYQIISDTAMGVQKGCDRSLFVLSGTLYYRSPDGLFAYNGSSSERIDAVLGSEHYSDVACCGTGTKLWVSMTGEQEDHSGLYVCDTEKGLWHKEDAVTVLHMARFENDVYIVDSGGQMFTVNGSKGDPESGEVRFFAETGVIGYSTPDSKYVSRFALRVAVPHDGSLQIFVEYDSANVWEFMGSIEGNGMGTFTVPVVPRRCDHFRIRLAGKGNCRIFGFSKVLEKGGNV